MKYSEILSAASTRLGACGIAENDTDAWILLSETFGLNRGSYFFKKEEQIPESETDKIELFFQRLKRRESREPVQYILGNQDFYGLYFKVNPDVLIPRLDTEVLVEEILKSGISGKRVLDLCTGSGCIIETLAHEGNLTLAVGTDISEAALKVAEENARNLGVNVKLLQGDLFGALKDGEVFDVIVSNPPYIAEKEKPDLASEVIDHEPHLALFADHDGLYFYEKILAQADEFLAENGTIWFEIGCTQAEAIKEIANNNGFSQVQVIRDLAGLDRVLKIHKGNPGAI